jgi:hypothetical protein
MTVRTLPKSVEHRIAMTAKIRAHAQYQSRDRDYIIYI